MISSDDLVLFPILVLLALASYSCSNSPTNDGGGDSDGDSDGDTDSHSDSDSNSDTDSDGDLSPDCAPLSPPTGNVINVSPQDATNLQNVVGDAAEGDTILLADGTYSLAGSYLWFATPNVTMRSASGNPEDVILDGEYDGSEIVTIAASNVTIAELTITRAYTHPIHVTSSDAGSTLDTRIYRVHIIDPREQGIKINTHADTGVFADDGEIACSRIVLTDEGRPQVNPTSGGCYTGGIDAHQAKGWTIRDNRIEGFWCNTGLSEHAIHFWRGGRDTLVERNVLVNNARGIGFGMADSGDARTYEDNPCPAAGSVYVGHYNGIIRNNAISAFSPDLLFSPDGFDCGICLWSACGTKAVHNTIVSTGDNFSSIEWRFAGSQDIGVSNNLTTHPLREREEASAVLSGNLEGATMSLFVDSTGQDVHLSADATQAIDMGVPLEPTLCDRDMDNEQRDSTPDIGADEI